MGGTKPPSATPRSSAAEASILSGAGASFGLAAGPWAAWQEDDLPAGTQVGDVVIGRLLARGGMGSVYEARQTTPARTVAVKVVREGRLGPDVLRRFEYEARVLARLRHPHIAQIHACGTFASARGPLPYIVMELVDGARSITAHAAAAGLSIRERVRLFRDVAAAVAHGHGKGVIHRDLKPGNILVDAAGWPKVIDFGVARTLHPEDTRAGVATGAGDLVGTLRYMSPEQLGADPDEVDARTDVYALGLVLHELLTGALPYDLQGKSPVEAARILDGRAAPETAPLARAVRAEGRLRADEARSLAAIVARCLEPRAEDRYATAVEVEAELERWLAGEAVLARPLGGGETLWRLAVKHRAATAAALAAVGAVVVAGAGITWFSLRAETQRRAAVAARALAESRQREAGRQTAVAQGQLYLSTVLLAAEARDRDNLPEAARLLATAADLVAAAGPGHPLELDCLSASLDDATAVHRGHRGIVTAVGWSPDGRRLVTGDADGSVRLFTAGAAGDSRVIATHAGAVWAATFSPDGRLVATAAADATVRLHDAATDAEVAVIDRHHGPVYAATFSPDGSLLATAGRDGTVRLHDTATWHERRVLKGHDGTVYAAAFSPDGGLLASGGQDGMIHLWDVATGTGQTVIAGHEGRIFRIEFSAAGRRLATASADATARVWDVDGGPPVAVMRHPFRVNAVAFVDGDRRIATASGDGLLRIWDVDPAAEVQRLRGHAAAVWSLAVVPGTTRAATGSADGTAREWDLEFAVAPVIRCGDRVLATACSSSGRTLAVGTAASRVLLYDAATLLPAGDFTVEAGRVNGVAWAPDDRTVAVACDDGTVRLWPQDAAQEPTVMQAHRRRVYAVAFSADGRRLATAAEDRTARVWDVATGAAACPPLRHPKRVFCAAFSPDGGQLATAGEDGITRLWNLATGVEVRRFTGHDAAVNWVAFAPDGGRIATASSDHTVRLWNVADGRSLATLTGPARQIWKVAFSPDGTRVAAVSADGTAQLWDAASGRSAALLRGHCDQVWALAFAADGRSLVTGSWDGTVRAWGVSAAEIARRRMATAAP